MFLNKLRPVSTDGIRIQCVYLGKECMYYIKTGNIRYRGDIPMEELELYGQLKILNHIIRYTRNHHYTYCYTKIINT